MLFWFLQSGEVRRSNSTEQRCSCVVECHPDTLEVDSLHLRLAGVRGSRGYHREWETYEFGHEGNHEIEQANGLDKGKAQNGIREELAAQAGVAGDAADERSKDEADADTRARQADGGRAHAQVPRHLDHGLGDLGRVLPARLEVVQDVARGGGALALERLQRAGLGEA